jgi:hypothetical protein
MDSLINKYFSDNSILEDYTVTNMFHPPADLETIKEVETALSIKFPSDYVTFLLTSNGYGGKIGQSYSTFIPAEKIVEYTTSYGGEFFPWIVFIGTDGGNEMYVLDKRNNKLKFGILPYIGDENDFILLGETFEEFVRHLYHNDFWGSRDTA